MRDNLRAMATETMTIIEAGRYRSAGGRDVQVGAAVTAGWFSRTGRSRRARPQRRHARRPAV